MRLRLLLICLLLVLASAYAADINTLRQQAILRDKNAQYQLALHYQQGQGVKADPKQSFYWMEQAAENGHKQAQLQVANAYLNGSVGVTPDKTQAIYWLTRLATQGDTTAQFKLGQLYEQVTDLSGETQALIWYRIAGLSNPTAEQRYSQLLEQQFNHRRMKEISRRKALEDAQAPDTTISPVRFNNAQADAAQFTLPQIISSVIVAVLMLALTLLGVVYIRLKKQLRTAESTRPEVQLPPSEPLQVQSGTTIQQQKIKQQEQTIRKQKQQMTMLFQEMKRLQQTPPKQPPARPNSLDLACALFGFSVTEIPDVKQIKLRYKQLSKIYHPDMKGSDEEMKRLNQALKSLLAHQQSTSAQ
ncbi:tetratricopeptide repeat protein [Vibrio spartinae]|uniref:Localization factor PodJL n=1 Tax=Vibrio spartinae TaxID=1918945 RepID=A0A1N6M6L3_9VIBR|nr:tetratricopeptide repeat protein [Vibrio spartinae]SIO95082.1 Localization factor PodJL [Vibrio spartinae]